MSTTLLLTLCALVIPLALRLILKWIYLPIKIRHRNLPRIEHEYTLTANENLTQEQRDLIADYVNQFTTEGFEVAANVLTDLAASDATAVSVLLVVLRKTWKGTFLSAWKHQQPVKTLRVRYRDRAARKIWNDLGMNGWTSHVYRGAVAAEIEILPVAEVNAGQPSPIEYQTALAAGEVRVEWKGTIAIIRCGKPSISAYLLMCWASVAWITFCAFVMLALLPQIWILYHLRLLGALPAGLRFGGFVTSVAVLAYLFLRSVFSIFSGLRRTRGTTTLTASPSGLHFENAPARPGCGSIRREELQNLIIVQRESHLFQSLYQLEASVLDRFSRQPLLVATNPAKLREARKSIARAMGIEKPEEATAV